MLKFEMEYSYVGNPQIYSLVINARDADSAKALFYRIFSDKKNQVKLERMVVLENS